MTTAPLLFLDPFDIGDFNLLDVHVIRWGLNTPLIHLQ